MTEETPDGKRDLLETFRLLAEAILDNPLLSLAHAVVWFDPLWGMDDDDWNEEDSLGRALSITRHAFPDIYAGLIVRMRSSTSERELESFVCGEISQRGIPLDNLEYMGYGIPLTACGIDLSEPEFYTAHPDWLPLLGLFGIHPEGEHYPVELPDRAYTAGQVIANSLVNQADPAWQQAGWALAWLFACSGNTLIDCTDEALAEIQPLSWDEEEIAFAIELIEETDDMLEDIAAGLKWLEAQPQTLDALSANVKRVCKALARQKGKKDELHIRLEWPPLVAGGDGAAVHDPELLQLRPDAP